MDGCGPELTEVTGVPQFLAEGQHEILALSLGAIDGRGQAARVVGPVDAIESLSLGTFDPALHAVYRSSLTCLSDPQFFLASS